MENTKVVVLALLALGGLIYWGIFSFTFWWEKSNGEMWGAPCAIVSLIGGPALLIALISDLTH